MPKTYSKIYLHYIFTPKYRNAIILPEFEERLYKYISGIVKSLDQTLIQINGMPDHIHLLVRLKPTMASATFIQKVKGNSSKWINEQKFLPKKFRWQIGSAVFSVDYRKVDIVKNYIKHQKEHHNNVPFKKEFVKILDAYKVEYDKDDIEEFFL